MEITTAKIEEMDVVRTLFREYQQWLCVDLCFQNLEKEFHELPGCYKAALSSNLKRKRAHAFYASFDFEPHGYSFRVNTRNDAAKTDSIFNIDKRLFQQS